MKPIVLQYFFVLCGALYRSTSGFWEPLLVFLTCHDTYMCSVLVSWIHVGSYMLIRVTLVYVIIWYPIRVCWDVGLDSDHCDCDPFVLVQQVEQVYYMPYPCK
jgi:hypothetical protein